MKSRGATKTQLKKLARLLNFDLAAREAFDNTRQLSFFATEQKDLVVVGVDEVGRGCLAGPVVAAAVCLPKIEIESDLARSLSKLDDSKALSPGERLELSIVLKRVAHWAIGEATVEEIDRMNILQASLLAMKRARAALELVSDVVLLVDGNKKVPGVSDRQLTVVKGDSSSASIAAASIIAKVHRDDFMGQLAADYPHYHWQNNKGYGSEPHRLAIATYGLTDWHRKSFNWRTPQPDEPD